MCTICNGIRFVALYVICRFCFENFTFWNSYVAQLRFVTLRHVTFTLCCFTLCSNILGTHYSRDTTLDTCNTIRTSYEDWIVPYVGTRLKSAIEGYWSCILNTSVAGYAAFSYTCSTNALLPMHSLFKVLYEYAFSHLLTTSYTLCKRTE